MQLASRQRKKPSRPPSAPASPPSAAAPKDRERLEAALGAEIAPWRGLSSHDPAAPAPARPFASAEPASTRQLKEEKLREAVESLIDPTVRLNIAGRSFATLNDRQHHEATIVALSRDYFRLLVRHTNRRIGHALSPRAFLHRLTGRTPSPAGAAEVPFVLREIAVIRSDGRLVTSVSDGKSDGKLPALLKQEARTTSTTLGGPGRSNGRSAPTSSAFARLEVLARANSSPGRRLLLLAENQVALLLAVDGEAPSPVRKRLEQTRAAISGEFASAPFLPEIPERLEKVTRRHLETLLEFSRKHHHTTRVFPWLQAGFGALLLIPLGFAIAGLSGKPRTSTGVEVGAALEGIPGIEVMHIDAHARPVTVVGLRDPLAENPAATLEAQGLDPGDYDLRFHPYQSADPKILQARVHGILSPPPSVALTMADGTVRAAGDAPRAWLETAATRSALLPAGLELDLSGVIDDDLFACRQKAGELLKQRLYFEAGEKGAAIFADDQLTKIVRLIKDLQKSATGASIPLAIHIGARYADSDPDKPFTASQLRIARDRAISLRDELLAREARIDPALFVPVAAHPVAADHSDAQRLNRSVEFAVTLDGEKLRALLPPAGSD